MAIPGNITVASEVGVLPYLVRTVTLDRHNGTAGHFDNYACVTDLPAGLEEHLVTDFRVLIIAPLLLVVLSRVNATSAERAGLALGTLAFDCPVSLEKASVDETVTPGIPVLVAIIIARGSEVAGTLCPVVPARVGGLIIQTGVGRFLMVADLCQGNGNDIRRLTHDPHRPFPFCHVQVWAL